MRAVPVDFAERMRAIHGAEGQEWLEQLPRLLERCAQQWSLKLEEPYSAPSYNLVVRATRFNGEPVVLKVGVPNDELRCELEALQAYAGKGCARLLDALPEAGALLLERLAPGTMLVTLDDDEATRIAARVMQQLWRPLPAGQLFPTAAQWARGLQRLRKRFGASCGPFPKDLVEAAERLYEELLASAAEPVLLHGDLHHYNILAAERAPWLAIDPKGLSGEPLYETGALMRNPMPQAAGWRDLQGILELRASILGELLEADRKRILGWGVAQAVLSSWWSFEEEGKPGKEALRLAASMLGVYEKL